jgi:IS30 family transposase
MRASTISRELGRNRNNHDMMYRAEVAHSYSTARRRRQRRGSHFTSQQMKQVIILLIEKWSPEQIADHVKRKGSFTVSHETIYKYILTEKKHGGTLFKNLRIMPKSAESVIIPGIQEESRPESVIFQQDPQRSKPESSWVIGKEILPLAGIVTITFLPLLKDNRDLQWPIQLRSATDRLKSSSFGVL